MSLWDKHLLPRLIHFALNTDEVVAHRKRVLEGLTGDVLELGIGSGLNVPHFPKSVHSLVGVEPSATALEIARKTIAKADLRVELVCEGAETFVRERSFDAVVSTFTICTIPEIDRALDNARRSLRPGGRLHFIEHGLCPDPKVAKWQRRLEPIQRTICGGCHLTRDIRKLIEGAGFSIESIENFHMKGTKPHTYVSRGVAVTAT